MINLGCIDLNQWYARCDDVNHPDYLHFDLDPGVGAPFDRVRETALVVREALDVLKMPSLVKTTGSKGMHVYVPIVRGPEQKQVWTFAKALAQELAARHPALMTAEYRVAKRPRGRVLVDYNQNAWGRTLASIYSVRPRTERPSRRPSRGARSNAASGSKTSPWRTYRRGLENSAICGSRFWRRRDGSIRNPIWSRGLGLRRRRAFRSRRLSVTIALPPSGVAG